MELEKCESWDKRFNIFAKRFSEICTHFSLSNLKILCTTLYKHLSVIRNYDLSTFLPIKSPITLIKCTSSFIPMKIEEDYDLHKVLKKFIIVCTE